MRPPILVCVVAVAVSFYLLEREVSAQIISPSVYGGSSLSYGGDNDDDIGILLAILLLAARNRGGYGGGCGGGGCCNCCNCNNARTIPVPYPIPFPTNNPIIRQYNCDDKNDVDYKPSKKSVKGSDEEPTQVINFVSENDDETKTVSKFKNDPTTMNKGSSTAIASANSKDKKPKKEEDKKEKEGDDKKKMKDNY